MGMGNGRRHSPARPLLLRVCGGSLFFAISAYILFFRGKGVNASSAPSGRRCALDSYDASATTELDLKDCSLERLPPSILRFTSLVKLDVSKNAALQDLPPLPPTLRTIFALGGGFESIPRSVAALPSLRMLSFKSCRLRDVGDAPLPTSLEWLILTDNHLTALPAAIGSLVRMRKLMLANNRLSALPASMGAMSELELLRVANNRLESIPPWLLALPKLTWLAIAGNPCVAPAPARAALPAVQYKELALGARLGEGTSSVVRKGEWRAQTIAVKVYKARLSSDGQNLDEVRASCAVDHPNVLRWLGYVEEGAREEGAREEARASSAGSGWRLVGLLEWSPGFTSLGKPPSMDSVTRDTYPPSARFGGAEIRDIARGICAALQHLHSRSLAHGDLYAHNILWRRNGGAAAADTKGGHARRGGADGGGAVAKLSDFGAAFYYGGASTTADGVHYERFEQRAFGFLLEELLERHDGTEPRLLPHVRAAATAATATVADDRPGFSALLEILAGGASGGLKGRKLLRPRSRFGRVLPDGHPLKDKE